MAVLEQATLEGFRLGDLQALLWAKAYVELGYSDAEIVLPMARTRVSETVELRA